MAVLNDVHKRFIVQCLACWDTPSQVSEDLREEFGLDVPRTQVAQYDPTKAAGKQLGKKWCELFEETRKRFKSELAEIPIAEQAFRLRALNRIYQRHMAKGNTVAAAAILEQAAKEVGGAFTNKREHTGADGGPIEQRTVVVDESKVAAALDQLEREY